jgi:hypothetical protein
MIEYSQAAIDAQRKIVKNLDKKLKGMGSLVPPPIRAEVTAIRNRQVDIFNAMLDGRALS